LRILVTNDDGVTSDGLWTLVKELVDVGEVCVVAPDRDMSGVGTGLTLLDVLRVHEYTSPVDGVVAYSVQGTPADCVILAVGSLFSGPFDLLVSGINPGANIGLDVLCSGTVGGALQGSYLQIPAIAVSAVYSDPARVRYGPAARAAGALARGLGSSPVKGPLVLNVNVPDVGFDEIEGVEVTQVGPLAYRPNVERTQDGRRTYYWIKHNEPVVDVPPVGTDVWAVRNRRISITPLDLGLTDGARPTSLRALTDGVRAAIGPGSVDTKARTASEG
jgi:5'-nucleotidase